MKDEDIVKQLHDSIEGSLRAMMREAIKDSFNKKSSKLEGSWDLIKNRYSTAMTKTLESIEQSIFEQGLKRYCGYIQNVESVDHDSRN